MRQISIQLPAIRAFIVTEKMQITYGLWQLIFLSLSRFTIFYAIHVIYLKTATTTTIE